MRLVCKTTEGKLPFIGILYEGEAGANANSKNLSDYNNKILKMRINSSYGRLFIYIYDENENELGYYRAVEYDLQEYKLWRAYTHREINFGHCYMSGNHLKIARTPEGKMYVLKITRFSHEL